MPQVIIVRLTPLKPVAAADFTPYLTNLSIKAFDLSFGSPQDGILIGEATGSWVPNHGTNASGPPLTPATQSIIQHATTYDITILPGPVTVSVRLEAVATAFIALTPPPKEYKTSDLRLEIRQNGTLVAYERLDFNVVTLPDGPLSTNPLTYQNADPALVVALPNPLSPVSFVPLPADGSAPKFAPLKTAIDEVLAQDPGGGATLATISPLTAAQARHVAREIIWNRMVSPPPDRPHNRPLHEMYTRPPTNASLSGDALEKADMDRMQYEASLKGYYSLQDANSDRFAQYVFAASAAVWAEQQSAAPGKIGLQFPIETGVPPVPGATFRQAEAVLESAGPFVLDFSVPAAYFYALAANVTSNITPHERYRMATGDTEPHLASTIRAAIVAGTITIAPTMPENAARRLVAIGRGKALRPIMCTLNGDVMALVNAWLAHMAPSIDGFWQAFLPALAPGHFDLVLAVLTQQTTAIAPPVSAAIEGGLANTIAQIKLLNTKDWHDFFLANPALLPEFTKPGTPEERAAAFVRRVRKFFEVLPFSAAPIPGIPPAPLAIPVAASDPLQAFMAAFPGFALPVANWNDPAIATALEAVFAGDEDAQDWLLNVLHTLDELFIATSGVATSALQISLMEALFARGFTSRAQIQALTEVEFIHALTGTIAYEWGADIAAAAGGSSTAGDPAAAGPFTPINPDGSLINCIPPWHLSPFGPVQYLKDLLATGIGTTCDEPTASGESLAALLSTRRGALDTLLASAPNVHTVLPLIDIVNENLEHLAAGASGGVVLNTNASTLASHALRAVDDSDAPGHAADTLFGALPEHSSPATPVKAPTAYVKLAADFSAPMLPYSQPLDIARSYLRALGTRRFHTMRAFRRDITEFALDANMEAADFQKHLWRYPVRMDLGLEYLCLSQAEYEALYSKNPSPSRLRDMYGFASDMAGRTSWKNVVVQVPEFIKRTGLSYCEFLELWESKFVEFENAQVPSTRDGETMQVQGYPRCEPCCPEDLVMHFIRPSSVDDALRRLMVFIRLWRTLRCLPGARYSFSELADICRVLKLYVGAAVNPEFIRQLAAFQIMRDDWSLDLGVAPKAAAGAQDADRTRLLGLWAGPAHASFHWAADHLLGRIEDRAEREYAPDRKPGSQRRHRAPEFIKVLRDNLDDLSILAGFGAGASAWHAAPTGTLRFTEVLAKIYSSYFTTGELLYIFADHHLNGDDPFYKQDANEALDQPFDFPEEGSPHDLWQLRRHLLEVEPGDDAVAALNWQTVESAMRSDFGYDPVPALDPLRELANHFFPEMMTRLGLAPTVLARQYRTPLAATVAGMWNQPPGGPFQYDALGKELFIALPLSDEAVLAKLNAIEQLTPAERDAVQQLYFSPRAELARFSFLFPDLAEAERALIEEPDEAARWTYFARSFVVFTLRARVVAEHLAAHVAGASDGHEVEVALAALILRRLLADENRAGATWEADDGQPPAAFDWEQPAGGALAALTALAGTGLLGEFASASGVAWQEVRGPMTAFAPTLDSWNTPVPAMIPRLDFSMAAAGLKFAILRNGLAIRESDGGPLAGAEGFTVHWRGVLIVEESGVYTFYAGAPTPGCEAPDFESCGHNKWRVNLRRGQKTWLLLNYRWGGETAPDHVSGPLHLKRGAYFIDIDFEEDEPEFDEKLELARARTGFTVKYSGADTGDCIAILPNERLYRDVAEGPLQSKHAATPAAKAYLANQYSGSLRDIRRTYQRAFKALLLSHRLRLSAKLGARAGVSEIEYMLSNGGLFAGMTYVAGGPYTSHAGWFDFNLLPVDDTYNGDPARSPAPALDMRAAPSVKRRQALFDWFERLHDYTVMRRHVVHSAERQAWHLFVEASNQQSADVIPLLADLGIDLDHAPLLLDYHAATTLDWQMLADDRWAIRAWRAALWVRQLTRQFAALDLGAARPSLWATDDGPGLIAANEDLTLFYRRGMIERGAPVRYTDIKELNNGLRLRARAALLAYLCGMDRVALPFAAGTFATTPKDLSALLLLDVEAGVCQKASRIEEAASAVQAFVERARLSLEPALPIVAPFATAWDRIFGSFRTWQACRRRIIYRENFIEWSEHGKAVQTEAFRFLEAELRRNTFTAPEPAGMENWPGPHWPDHASLAKLQHREPSHLLQVSQPENLGLMGRPERHARPGWLAASRSPAERDPNTPPSTDDGVLVVTEPRTAAGDVPLPLWIQSAVRLGTRFLRIAAAGEPPASAAFTLSAGGSVCCAQCGAVHPPVIDEYYFWLVDGKYYEPRALNPDEPERYQDADWGVAPPDMTSDWHRTDKLPQLLAWETRKMVRLAWCRVHNGEFQTPRYSDDGAHARLSGPPPELRFMGRSGDSLRFEITNASPSPQGYGGTDPWGFRYDLVPDTAVVLPEVLATSAPSGPWPPGLGAYPFFLYFRPGAPLEPSLYSTAMTVAAALRANCRYEPALKWYERYYAPADKDLRWATCRQPRIPQDDDHDTPTRPTGRGVRGRAAARGGNNRNAVALVRQSRGTAQDPCCDTRTSTPLDARRRSTLLAYLDTMLLYAQCAICRNSAEGFTVARLRLDSAARYLGARPRTIFGQDDGSTPVAISSFVPRFAPLNPRLMELYDRLDDQLEALHHCLNKARIPAGTPHVDSSYWGDSNLRRGWKELSSACIDDDGCCCPPSPYRFAFLLQRALETAGEVRGFGAALLAAYEKGDAEFLAAMRSGHERQMINLTEEVRRMEFREADWQVQALEKTKQAAQTRRQYYADLVANGLISKEQSYRNLTEVSMATRTAGNVLDGVSQVMHLIPDMTMGVAGIASTPVSIFQMPIGTKLAHAFSASARILFTVSDVTGSQAGLALTESGWDRREADWVFQVSVLDVEIEQIERQILAAMRRRDSALRHLNNLALQKQQMAELQDYLRDKFTCHSLYLFLQQETAALHHQMFDIAWCWARQAQRAFQLEREFSAQSFLAADTWDGLHEGLMAGERLATALRTMEKAYHDQNRREHELQTRLSLRMDFPLAFLELKATGSCEVAIPEWRLDREYPGHYLRRIRSVNLTIPCVAGPNTGVHCKLTLLSSATRIEPTLLDIEDCCPGSCTCGCCDVRRYEAGKVDPRIVKRYGATEAIATSTGQNDSGLFELNFRDERYLPFEYAGAVSRWRIELPAHHNAFDVDTVSDVLFQLQYTAREGGTMLRDASWAAASCMLPGAGLRFFDWAQDFSESWQRFRAPACGGEDAARALSLRMNRAMFAYLPGQRPVRMRRVEIWFEVKGCDGVRTHDIEFVPGRDCRCEDDSEACCERYAITCVASADWPCLFHGVLEYPFPYLYDERPMMIGDFVFAPQIGKVLRAYLVCSYEAGEPERCMAPVATCAEGCAPAC